MQAPASPPRPAPTARSFMATQEGMSTTPCYHQRCYSARAGRRAAATCRLFRGIQAGSTGTDLDPNRHAAALLILSQSKYLEGVSADGSVLMPCTAAAEKTRADSRSKPFAAIASQSR